MKVNFKRSNLNQMIDAQLGILKASVELTEKQKQELADAYELTEEERSKDITQLVEKRWNEELKNQFSEFYENDLKTGFYIHESDNDNDEDVQFFNYNTEQGWFSVDLIADEPKLTFFDKSGDVILNQKSVDIKKHSILASQKNKKQLLKDFFNKYQYVVVLIYSGTKNLQNPEDDKTLVMIEERFSKLENQFFTISKITPHFADHESKEKSGIFRLSAFYSELPYYNLDGNKSAEKNTLTFDDFLKEIDSLQQIDQNLFAIPIFAKEEIKFVLTNDFDDEEANDLISYTTYHRYECLYDSESNEGNSEDSSSDDDDDEYGPHHKNYVCDQNKPEEDNQAEKGNQDDKGNLEDDQDDLDDEDQNNGQVYVLKE